MADASILGTTNNDKIVLGDDDYNISAFSGNNTIFVGNGNNHISAGDGNNSLSLGDGENEVALGNGRNRVVAADGATTLTTGSGHDTLTLGDGDNSVTAGEGNNRITSGDGDNTIDAGNGSDRIQVGGGANVIRAGGGRNSIAATGNTDIVTGDGDDKITLGDGQHVIAAGAGNNSISTGDATVEISTGSGTGRITVGNGSGTIQAGAGKNQIKAGDGTFTVEVGDGHNAITLGDGNSTVTAGGGNNRITLGDGDTHITAEDGANRISVGSGTHVIRAGDGRNSIVAVGVGNADIASGDGDDKITLGDGQHVIAAGAGNNSIITGDATVEITTGSGTDRITVGNGSGTIDAGAGKNQIKAGDGTFTVEAGDGHDAITLGDGNSTVTAGAGNNRITLGDGDTQITAENGADRITVGSGSHVIRAGDGKNSIVATGTADIVTGDHDDKIALGDGQYVVAAGAGNNSIVTGDGTVEISTGDGTDRITVGTGGGTIQAGDGKNQIKAGDGAFQITTGNGSDGISVGQGEGQIHAGSGANSISVAGGTFEIETGNGNDRITLADGSYVVASTGGNNQIKVGNADVTIVTGDGNDNILLAAGSATIDAGAGANRITAAGDVNTITTGDGIDTITVGAGSNIISAGAGNNRITAADGDLELTTLGGNNTIRMGDGLSEISIGGGNNRVSVGDGQHQISAGDGNNTIATGDATSRVTLGDGDNRVSMGDGDGFVRAGDGNNRIALGEGPAFVEVGNGKNSITLSQGDIIIQTGDGNNTITQAAGGGGFTSAITTGAGADRITLGDGNGEIASGAGNDIIRTGDGDGQIDAGAGNDQVSAGAGSDWITGGAGDDKLDGGDATDWAVFSGSFSDYFVESRNASTIQVSSTSGDVTDIGTDQLRNFEYIYFEGDDYTLDIRDTSILDTLYTVDLQDDAVTSTSNGPVEITLSSLLDNDTSTGAGTASYQVTTTSAAGLALTFDGENITYNADDALQHLAAGEVFSDSFTYTVVDANGNTGTATVNLTVTGQGSGPIAEDDRLTGGAQDLGLIGGDEFTVSDDGFRRASWASTISDGTGGHISVWSASGAADSSQNGIWVRTSGPNNETFVGPVLLSEAGQGGSMPVVTLLENGQFAVVWTTSIDADNEDGFVDILRGRTFNADGSPNSPEYPVSGAEGVFQLDPSVATLSNGTFATVWLSGTTYQGMELHATITNAAGEVVVEDFLIDLRLDPNFELLSSPNIAALPDGGFVVTWGDVEAFSGGGQAETVYASIYGSDGQMIVAPYEVPAENSSMNSGNSNVSVNEDGSFLIIWNEKAADDHHIGSSSVQATLYGADGAVLIEQFEIHDNDGSLRYGLGAEVAFLPNGQFVVVGRGLPEDPAATGWDYDIYAQIFNPDGSTATDQFMVNQEMGWTQFAPSIAVLDDNSFIITWSNETNSGGTQTEVQGRIFDFNGEPVSSYFVSEDSTAEIDVLSLLANDDLVESDGVVFSLESLVSENGADLAYDADTGLITYDPTTANDIQALAQGDSLEDTFTYTLTDAAGNSDTATVTLTVGGQGDIPGGGTDTPVGENSAPEANDDRLTGGPSGHHAYEGGGEFSLLGDGEIQVPKAPQVIAHEDGGYVSAWRGREDGEFGIFVRIIDGDGQEVIPQFMADDHESGSMLDYQLTELEDGGFILSWAVSGRGYVDVDTHVRMRIYNADGSARTDGIELSNTDGTQFQSYGIAGLSNGNILVSSEGNNGQGLWGTIYGPQGQQIGDPVQLVSGFSAISFQRQLDLEPLDNGGFIALWNEPSETSADSDQFQTSLHASIYDNDGNLVVADFVVASRMTSTSWTSLGSPKMAANDDGTFVLTWQETYTGEGDEVRLVGQVFTSDGSEISGEFAFEEQAPTTSPHRIAQGDVTWLSGDQFVLTWTGLDSSRIGVYAQIYNADGTTETDSFLVNQTEHFGQYNSSVALLSDGRFIISWFSNEHSGFIVKAQIFEGTGEAVDLSFTGEDSIATLAASDLLLNDADGDAFVFSLDGALSENGASLSYDADSGLITYDPTTAETIQALGSHEILEDTFTYTLSDGLGGFDQATVTVVVGGLDEVLT